MGDGESIPVVMRWFEILFAAQVALQRRIFRYKKAEENIEHEDQLGDDAGWDDDIESSIAEMAVAKVLRLFWNGSINTSKSPDVGTVYVRWTSVETGHLPIRPKDKAGKYVLVTGVSPNYVVRGWMSKETAFAHPEWKFVGRNSLAKPCQWIPQDALNSMDGI
jgi:hypothetical protein